MGTADRERTTARQIPKGKKSWQGHIISTNKIAK
jgi:hypothetical protein